MTIGTRKHDAWGKSIKSLLLLVGRRCAKGECAVVVMLMDMSCSAAAPPVPRRKAS